MNVITCLYRVLAWSFFKAFYKDRLIPTSMKLIYLANIADTSDGLNQRNLNNVFTLTVERLLILEVKLVVFLFFFFFWSTIVQMQHLIGTSHMTLWPVIFVFFTHLPSELCEEHKEELRV